MSKNKRVGNALGEQEAHSGEEKESRRTEVCDWDTGGKVRGESEVQEEP